MSMVDITLLQRLEPVASLAPEQLEYIAMYSKIEKCAPGTCLFRQGEEDYKMLYLLRGDVELSADKDTDKGADKHIISANFQPLINPFNILRADIVDVVNVWDVQASRRLYRFHYWTRQNLTAL